VQNIIFAFNIVAPLFALLAIGSIARQLRWLGINGTTEMNRLCLRVLFPCMILRNAIGADISKILNPLLLGFSLLSYPLAYFILARTVPRLVAARNMPRNHHTRVLSCQCHGGADNAAYMLGDAGAARCRVAVLTFPMNNVLVAWVLRRHGENSTIGLRQKIMLSSMLTKRLVIDSAVGIFLSVTRFPLPLFVTRSIFDLASAGTPAAMIALGANIDWKAVAGHLRYSIPVTTLKIVDLPAFFTVMGILLGFRGPELAAVFFLHATQRHRGGAAFQPKQNSGEDCGEMSS
jgi:predicted permease